MIATIVLTIAATLPLGFMFGALFAARALNRRHFAEMQRRDRHEADAYDALVEELHELRKRVDPRLMREMRSREVWN